MADQIVAYCRPGYEADTANELNALASEKGFFGYPEFNKDSALVIFTFVTSGHAREFAASVRVSDTVFCRQFFVTLARIEDVPREDRVGSVLSQLSDPDTEISSLYGDVRVEYPDTEEGKALAKFCRKFVVPLRQALRAKNRLTRKEELRKPALHVLFTDFETIILGESFSPGRSELPLGICRLKFPPAAPSRSTLKLEEAIVSMLTSAERERFFREGGRAVDLGACPGGWTFQLVQRGLYVEAIDNGKIADTLMQTGQVVHFAADGFTYRPQYGRVDLLVCDMIEQPDRVARLMGDWLINSWATHAIFNLKLPMKKRYETVTTNLDEFVTRLNRSGEDFRVAARHLYHDRDEITVIAVRG